MLPNYQARSPFVLKHTTSLYICLDVRKAILYFDPRVFVLVQWSTPSQTSLNRILCLSISTRITLEIELFTVLNSFTGAVKGARTPPTQFFVDGCYARLLLLYTYRGFSTTTQGQSTCRRSRSLILERIWRKYRGLVIKLWDTFLERCGRLELRNLVHY